MKINGKKKTMGPQKKKKWQWPKKKNIIHYNLLERFAKIFASEISVKKKNTPILSSHATKLLAGPLKEPVQKKIRTDSRKKTYPLDKKKEKGKWKKVRVE